MLESDIVFLKCIECSSLQLSLDCFEHENGDCISGRLSCPSCGSSWPVIKGIPRMLEQGLLKELVYPNHRDFFERHWAADWVKERRQDLKVKTAQSFAYEWLNNPTVLKEFERDWERYFYPFVKKEQLKGKIVAEIGCGMAKQGYYTAKHCGKYIGVDLSEAVEAAYANTKGFGSLIVQGDIYSLPVNSSKVWLFYSIGVLHHLPDPFGGFMSIVNAMPKKSKILVWVYGCEKNRRAMLLYNPLRVITTRIPKKILFQLCHIPALILHALNLLYLGLKRIGLDGVARYVPLSYYAGFPYSFKHNDAFDVFATPKQEYYTLKEIRGWFKRAGLRKVRLVRDKVQGIRGFAEK